MTEGLLPAEYQQFKEQEAELLTRARAAMNRMDILNPADRERLTDMIGHLDDLFTLVVVGEFNSGKSSVVNALLHDDYLDVGVLPTTSRIHILRHGRVKARRFEDEIIVHTHPARFLKDLIIVDTPGTNAVFREHERLAREFIHRSDFIFFVMAATHAFAETDRLYLELIRAYGTKVIIILNQIDALEEPEQIQEVTAFIGEQAENLLQFQPRIIPISARWALEARTEINPAKRQRLARESNLVELETFISDKLGQETRIQEKLRTPLRVLQTIIDRHRTEIESQLALAHGDLAVLEDLEAGEQAYGETMRDRIASRLTPVDRILEEMYDRGERFIDENLQLRRINQWLDWSEFQSAFEQAVVADAPERITRQVKNTIAELIAQDRAQWENTLRALRAMLVRHQDHVLGTVEEEFSGSIEVFEENVSRAEAALTRYRKQDAVDSLRNAQINALADTAVIGLSGLLGGGGLLAFGISEAAQAVAAIQAGAAASALLGPVGWALGGATALSGAYVLAQRRLPRARREAKSRLREQIDQLKATFREALLESASKELNEFHRHAQDALLPLQSYLQRLNTELEAMSEELDEISAEARRLQAAIESTNAT